ncbi:MAG: GNAT family N-acetyltransferase [Clostridia bacterium]|nr:GNAT family N-acetyltransferase [Clostridia bacterium]
MLTLCKKHEQLGFLPADPYAARITALFKTYGANYDFALFWVQETDGVPCAAISRVDGNLTLCTNGNADFEELLHFMNAVGFQTLTCSYDDMKKLGFEPSDSSFTVKYKGGKSIEKINSVRDYDKRKIFDLLCDCGFELGDYGAFLSDVCLRLNKGTASMIAAEENGDLRACAFALFEGKKSVLLGAVATSPEARGRGFASAIVSEIANEKSEKNVFLFCRNDGLEAFYSKIGFETVGKWTVLRRD